VNRTFLGAVLVLGALGYSPADDYFPPPEAEGGWRVAAPATLGVDPVKLSEATAYFSTHTQFTRDLGGALLIVYKGHLIHEEYVTGSQGGPQPWTARTCNDIKSSTKSVFGTAAGVFLEEFKDKVNLETLLIGSSREGSLTGQAASRCAVAQP